MSCRTLQDLCLNCVRRELWKFDESVWSRLPGRLKEKLIERCFWHSCGHTTIENYLLGPEITSLRLDEVLGQSLNQPYENSRAPNFINESFLRKVAEKCPSLAKLSMNGCRALDLQKADLFAQMQELVELSLIVAPTLDLEGALANALVRLGSENLQKLALRVDGTVRPIATIDRLQTVLQQLLNRFSHTLLSFSLEDFELKVPSFFQSLSPLGHLVTLELVNWHAMMLGQINLSSGATSFVPVNFGEFLPLLQSCCPVLQRLSLKCRCFTLHKSGVDFSSFVKLKDLELRGHSFSGKYQFPTSLENLNLTCTIRQQSEDFAESFTYLAKLESFVFHPTCDGTTYPTAGGAGYDVMESILCPILSRIGHLVTVLYLNKCTRAILSSVAEHCSRLQSFTCASPDAETGPRDLTPIAVNLGENLRCFISYWTQYVNMNGHTLGVVSQIQELLLDVLRCCPNLEALNLADLSFVDDNFLALLAFSCKSLRFLDLTGCPSVSDAGIKHLAENCPNLMVLQLQKTQVSDKSLAIIGSNLIQMDSIGISVREIIESEAREIASEILNTTHRVHSLIDRSYLIDRAVHRSLNGISCTSESWKGMCDKFVKPPKLSKYDFVHTYSANNFFELADWEAGAF